VVAANDGLAGAIITVLQKYGLNGQVPVTGQDATPDGLQAILRGDQYMTVYKPIKQEADATAQLAAALAKGDKAAADALATASSDDTKGNRKVPSVLLTPQLITKDNVKTVIDEGQVKASEVCVAATQSGLGNSASSSPRPSGCAAGDPGRASAVPGGVVVTEPILQLRGVDKHFGPVQVLHGDDFTVRAGEVTALVGDNGAGKSTLIKCVAGIHPIDKVEVLFDGEPVAIHGPTDASKLGIEVVYQDLALCDNLDIVQNMFLGRERGHSWLLDEADMEQAARRTLASLSVRTVTSVRMPVASLSGGQRQTVAIAKAVPWDLRSMLDEPIAALGVRQTRQVLDLMAPRRAGPRRRPHQPQHGRRFEVSDRIATLYLGRMVAEVAPDVTHTRPPS
jgi:D-xylose transport system ATP-binding protein